MLIDRFRTPEVVLGALYGAALMGGIWGWTDSYAPTERQKQECYDRTQRTGQKGDECKTFWERTTSDPVAFFTLVLAVSTGGLWLVTIGLYVAGERQIKIAGRAADTAERALVAGQRAFVSVAFRHNAVRNVHTKKITHWTFAPIWTNAGDTPTRGMRNHINIHIFDGPIPTDWEFPDLWSASVPSGLRISVPMGIAPKSSIEGQSLSITVETVDEVVSGSKQLFMWGWAEYGDVFPDTSKHITRFAVRIVAGGNPRNSDLMSFSYSYLTRYNCTDEECEHQGFSAGWKPQ
jgi:hypothetical protein